MVKALNLLFITLIFIISSCSPQNEAQENKKDEKSEKLKEDLGIEKVRIYAGQPGSSQKPIYQWELGSSKPNGIEPRLIEYILNQIGVDYEYIIDYPLDGYGDTRIQAIVTEKSDISIKGITITEGRKDKVDFTSPYYIDGLGVMVSNNSDYADLEDLRGRKVFAYRFSTTYRWAKENLTDCKVISQEDIGLGKHPVQLLREGKIAAYLSDYSSLKRAKANNLDMRIFPRKYTEERFGIAVSKKHPKLLEAINDVLAKMKESGRLDDFTRGYEK